MIGFRPEIVCDRDIAEYSDCFGLRCRQRWAGGLRLPEVLHHDLFNFRFSNRALFVVRPADKIVVPQRQEPFRISLLLVTVQTLFRGPHFPLGRGQLLRTILGRLRCASRQRAEPDCASASTRFPTLAAHKHRKAGNGKRPDPIWAHSIFRPPCLACYLGCYLRVVVPVTGLEPVTP